MHLDCVALLLFVDLLAIVKCSPSKSDKSTKSPRSMATCTLWGIGTVGDLWCLRWWLWWECLGWERLEWECLYLSSCVDVEDELEVELELEEWRQCFCRRRGGLELVLDDVGLWERLLCSKVLLKDEVVEHTYDLCPPTVTFRLLLGWVSGLRREGWSAMPAVRVLLLSLAREGGNCLISRGKAHPLVTPPGVNYCHF